MDGWSVASSAAGMSVRVCVNALQEDLSDAVIRHSGAGGHTALISGSYSPLTQRLREESLLQC